MDSIFIDVTLPGTGIISAIFPEIFMAMDKSGKGSITSWIKTKGDLFLFWDQETKDGAVPLLEPLTLTDAIRVARNWVTKRVLEEPSLTCVQADDKQIHISFAKERHLEAK